MAYSDFAATEAYTSKHAGAGVEIMIVNALDPADVVIGATTGLSSSDDMEQVPVEEAGNDGVDEFVTGRHSGSGSIPAFFTPKWADSLPNRQNFIGRTFTILKRVAENFPGEGTVLEAFTGCKINRVGNQQGARGALTVDIAFVYERKYSGAQWAAVSGS